MGASSSYPAYYYSIDTERKALMERIPSLSDDLYPLISFISHFQLSTSLFNFVEKISSQKREEFLDVEKPDNMVECWLKK